MSVETVKSHHSASVNVEKAVHIGTFEVSPMHMNSNDVSTGRVIIFVMVQIASHDVVLEGSKDEQSLSVSDLNQISLLPAVSSSFQERSGRRLCPKICQTTGKKLIRKSLAQEQTHIPASSTLSQPTSIIAAINYPDRDKQTK